MAPPPSYQHYIWASGHFILLVASLRCFLAFLTFKPVSLFWYKASYTGALVSYAIVCNKSLGPPQFSLGYIRRAFLDENVQYFLVAMYWFTSKPITVTLLPYMVFSLFHALTFTRTTLLPHLLPPTIPPSSSSSSQPQPHPMAKRLQAWVKSNYDPAMHIVAYTELLILVRVTLGALLFRNALLSPILYAHFLRQRYFQSAFTRQAVVTSAAYIETLVSREGMPPVLRTVWETGKDVVRRWGGIGGAPQAAAGEEH